MSRRGGNENHSRVDALGSLVQSLVTIASIAIALEAGLYAVNLTQGARLVPSWVLLAMAVSGAVPLFGTIVGTVAMMDEEDVELDAELILRHSEYFFMLLTTAFLLLVVVLLNMVLVLGI